MAAQRMNLFKSVFDTSEEVSYGVVYNWKPITSGEFLELLTGPNWINTVCFLRLEIFSTQ